MCWRAILKSCGTCLVGWGSVLCLPAKAQEIRVPRLEKPPVIDGSLAEWKALHLQTGSGTSIGCNRAHGSIRSETASPITAMNRRLRRI